MMLKPARTSHAIAALGAARWRVAIMLTIAMMVLYFGFILLVAFNKPLLGGKLTPGLSLGILLGALVIVASWALIWIYTRWANTHYDADVAAPAVPRSVREPCGGTALGAPNPTAITGFLIFVSATLFITYWAARKTKTTEHFYAAGRSITGLQNGLALAGDYMSAASFLGIAGLVALSGFDGLIYSIGFLVGWPIVMFLIAEPLRNLGPLYVHRRRGDAAAAGAGAGRRRDRLAGGGVVLSDRADGGRGQPGPSAVRHRLRRRRSSSSAS